MEIYLVGLLFGGRDSLEDKEFFYLNQFGNVSIIIHSPDCLKKYA